MIRVTGVTKTFRSDNREVVAIDEATINIGDNEIVVLLGPSGSGKTTLLRCVAGLDTADRGEIVIGDQTVFASSARKNVPAEKRGIGMVFQSYAIWPHLTVGENVALPLTHGCMGVSKPVVKARVAEALRAVQLSGLENRPAPYLSGGQQQRVALARALAIQPKALLMDEPLSNLDARLREEVRVEIRSIAKSSGVPVLYVTHDQTEAMDLADRVAVMEHGRIVQIDTPEGVYDHPANPAMASFLGSMNWVDGKITPDGRIETPLGLLVAPGASDGPMVQVGIRPEKIALSLTAQDGDNVFGGRCAGMSFLGDHRIYRIAVGRGTVMVKHSGDFPRDCIGKDVYLKLSQDSVLVFPDSKGAAMRADIPADVEV